MIELDGSLAGNANGLNIASGGSTVRGLAINRFVGTPNIGIFIFGPGGNVIQGNYIGTNLAGDAVFPPRSQINYGVDLFGSDGNVIGTDGDGVNDAAEGNLISGDNTGRRADPTGRGGCAAGQQHHRRQPHRHQRRRQYRLGQRPHGRVLLVAGTGNRIGTNADGVSDTAERNLISGNPEAGIHIDSNGNVVAGNYIGTNAAANAPLSNGVGVRIGDASNNTVGGKSPGAET